jgi:hypothetical protein
MIKEFESPTKGKLDLDRVAKEIVTYIKDDPERSYQLVIGTDSEGNGKVEFVTAIVIYRKGKGGRYFWKKFSKPNIIHLKQKIYEEVNSSLSVGQDLLDRLKKYWQKEDIKSALEIHIDVGENGPTKDLIKEVVGMVLGYGFNAKIKPESYGASLVADRHL